MKAEPHENLQPFRRKETMKLDTFLMHIVISCLLFWAGSWVFNHFPYPIVGIFIAAGYPLIQLYRFIKKGKQNET